MSKTSVSDEISSRLDLYGHRNWIAIVDSAYPLQTAPGIDTVVVGGEQVDAVKKALEVLKNAKHVYPNVYVDNELAYVAEENAKGITAYRQELDQVIAGSVVKKLPHEDIIKKLDEASKLFSVLIIKTDCTMPYTSVFLELECGYWNPESEKALRDAVAQGGK
ncbi:MAG: hypothetical protein LBV12_10725 [Puniceicoccales bacterium]|jgi:D-ribose pyranose/furanose isomerase RbsD|nr:hypothetical protein [Puniceicoccales bacterium]